MNRPKTRPICRNCKHFYNTWEPEHPRGCRVYGFKTASTPSDVIKRETDEECLAFEKKAKLKKEKEETLDLNRDDLW